MGRPKTVTDEQILSIAREVFQREGHAASTRDIAQQVGISEAVLYQRFGSKDKMFFSAMAPSIPNVDEMLRPAEHDDPRAYLHGVTLRMAEHFGQVLPVALRLVTHPAFDRSTLGRALSGPARMHASLVGHLNTFAKQKRMRRGVEAATAQLLVSLAHDWALGHAMSGKRLPKHAPELEAMVDLVWNGLAPSSGLVRPRRSDGRR